MEIPQGFVEEIDYNELDFVGVVGRGAFGVVSRAKWSGSGGGIDVAVKLIVTESERKAFITELKQLSRVSHPNIVKLHGASTKEPVCLVMEYAEGGSLYNVLHGTGPLPSYSAAHAMSWALQCARGVAYLHDMKPKPLVHRDLKPPNLLLINGGTVLKICDFGTACDAHTHMTNNKGSAAWMAPEVFEGSNYSEKCDVFSFGIILWEVITRRKPFDEIGGPAFRIMWAVHNGTRPPLVKGCPKPIEILMTRCWSSNPGERPSMAEVTRIMARLFQFFSGADEPLVYPCADECSTPQNTSGPNSRYDTPQSCSGATPDTRGSTVHDTLRQGSRSQTLGDPVPRLTPVTSVTPVVIEDLSNRTSAPASLAASHENLVDGRMPHGVMFQANKRYSADLNSIQDADIQAQATAGSADNKQVRGHRRTGSYGTPFVPIAAPSSQPVAAVRGHKRTGSHGNTPFVGAPGGDMLSGVSMHHSVTAPANLDDGVALQLNAGNTLRSLSWAPGLQGAYLSQGAGTGAMMGLESTGDGHNVMYFPADYQLRPLPPCTTCPESMTIYSEHCRLAEEYLRVQAEISLLLQRKQTLVDELQQDEKQEMNTNNLKQEYTNLLSENDALKLLHSNLRKQVEQIRRQQPLRFAPDSAPAR